ncbi:hypothetical protein MINTMi198_17440 [Mycobacterium intracellulare M.i.198]|uniref:hypothetical protein n=1 Tax=Mycobacterium intracellulare TaxID=1767 RepID=UPI00036A8436|nr:hypothetical protein [Mycobacterium intracellulare]BCP36374.1 hypothetical protein MINTMi198_17440 [Mycobacterium intracellulare M.i.198]
MKLDVNKDPDDYLFPVNVGLAQKMLGKMLTHIEALGLPDKAEKANKDLIRQSFWSWWSDVQENSMTSYKGCIAPIEVRREFTNGTEREYVWMAEGDHVVRVA